MGICPACDGPLVWRHNGVWCDRCHRKVETCCEGAPQPACAPERPAHPPGRTVVPPSAPLARALPPASP